MSRPSSLSRLAAVAAAGMALAFSARGAEDPRTVVCAQACTLQVQAANGFIDIKTPQASGSLKTLYRKGDRFDLAAGQPYVLFFNESMDGWFSFKLQFTPRDGGSAWTCQVRTVAEPPFIRVDQAAWSGAPGKVEIHAEDRARTFLALDWHP
jgi:hypothetical protein